MKRFTTRALWVLLLCTVFWAGTVYGDGDEEIVPRIVPPSEAERAERVWEVMVGDRCLSLRSQPAADDCSPPAQGRHAHCPCEPGTNDDETEETP